MESLYCQSNTKTNVLILRIMQRVFPPMSGETMQMLPTRSIPSVSDANCKIRTRTQDQLEDDQLRDQLASTSLERWHSS